MISITQRNELEKINYDSIKPYKIKRFNFLTPEELHSDKSSKNIEKYSLT